MSNAEPSWELYGTFLEVLRGGSFSAAARTLGVAQPTVRHRVDALEEALGLTLFTRAPNGLVPTDTARAMQPYAESMAGMARALVRSVSGSSEAERGTVRVAASEIVGAEVMPPLLASFFDAHPEIQIELVLSNQNEDLLRRDADVAVRMVAPTQLALVARRVGAVALGIYASEAYVAAHGAPKTKAQLRQHALIGSDRERGLIDALAAAGVKTTPRDYALRTDNHLAQLAAIRAGLGLGVCQRPLAEERTPQLIRVLPALTFQLEVFVVMHEDLRSVRRVRAVFDHLVEGLARYTEATPPSRRRR